MGRKIRSIVSLTVAVSMLITLFTGCNSKQAVNSAKDDNNSIKGEVTYPIKTDVTLKYWGALNAATTTSATNFAETPLGKELEKKTGIKVQYIHPAQGQAKEQFNLLLASGDLPDIIEYDWLSFMGGPDKAINDGYILKLNDVMDAYAPNLKKYIATNKDIEKLIKTDSNNYLGFPFYREDDMLTVSQGPVMRKDWLDELGLKAPETIDQWYEALKQFKDKKGAAVPLSLTIISALESGLFTGAYGVQKQFYVDNDKIKYGPMEPGYKECLLTLKKWYDEKLLDNNFATLDTKTLEANIMNGNSGATFTTLGSGLGKFITTVQPKNANYDLVGVPYPVLNQGEKPKFSQKSIPTGVYAVITQNCKHIPEAVRFLDYGYTEEGHMLYNFGIENVSYSMENGYPKYTDLVMKNPEGLSPSAALSKYIKATSYGPFVQDVRFMEQYASLPQQKAAWKTWTNTDADKHVMPLLYFMPNESSEVSKTMSSMKSYTDEMLMKFLMGGEPIANFDKYVAQLKEMGIEKAITIEQAAYERYKTR